MMAVGTWKLLVEGSIDHGFFESLCRTAGFADDLIEIGPPSRLTGGYDGKQGVISALDDYLSSARDGRIKGIGIVLDADFSQTDGLGFRRTYEQFAQVVRQHGYFPPEVPPKVGWSGFLFSFPRGGMPTVGLWIMPNNQDDGYLENYCLEIQNATETLLIEEARIAIKKLRHKKFQAHNETKALAATWLAWQRRPGRELRALIGDQLIDTNHAGHRGLVTWLRQTFSSTPRS